MEYLRLLRPIQWVKNIFIFVPIIFAREFFVADKLWPTVIAAITFCFVASSMYIVNDILDQDQDRLHPKKKFRPIASGAVPVANALVVLLVLLSASAFMAGRYVPHIIAPLAVYIVLNLAYSLYLKHQALFDVLLVAAFYLLRILVGGFATDTFISSWLVLCVIFLTTFIILGKRYAELTHEHKRAVLQAYSPKFLEHLLTISAALTIVAYGIYSILGVENALMVYSIFFVLLGMFRYLHIIYSNAEAENPERILFSDRVILLSVVGWLLFVGYIFYLA